MKMGLRVGWGARSQQARTKGEPPCSHGAGTHHGGRRRARSRRTAPARDGGSGSAGEASCVLLGAASSLGSVEGDELGLAALRWWPLHWRLLGHRRLLLGRTAGGRHLGRTSAIYSFPRLELPTP